MTQQLFPVFDPITEKFLYYKPRDLVHVQGDWHRGIQANIVRHDGRNSFEILVQKRSGSVDIGRYKLDQSLATQMLQADRLSPKRALRRGMQQELGVTEFKAKQLDRQLRIIKTYKEHEGMLNRELLALFVVKLEDGEIPKICSPKTLELGWINWEDFIIFFRLNHDQFTKTAQFYFSSDELIVEMERLSRELLSLPNLPRNKIRTKPSPLMRIDNWDESSSTHSGDIDWLIKNASD